MICTFLERHIRLKHANQEWISQCLSGDIGSFPYRPNPQGQAEIGGVYRPDRPMVNQVHPKSSSQVQFVVNIPLVHTSTTCDYRNLQDRISLIGRESFGKTDRTSLERVRQNVAVVFGINRYMSLDDRINRLFYRHIKRIPQDETVVHRVICFFWEPKWTKTNRAPHLHSLLKSFKLLRLLSREQADAVRERYEFSETLNPDISIQIPFQRIRETIKNSRTTRGFVSEAERRAPNAPIYYVVMDGDFLRLRTDSGIFTRLERKVVQIPPSVISLGYQLSPDELPLIRLGVKMDMAVRAAMASILPFSAYFSEPCTAFLVRKAQQIAYLSRISFLGRGNALETRRFIESGRAQGYFDGPVVYDADGGVTTKTPQRMYTEKNQGFQILSLDQLKQKRCLQALRAVSQSHATPKQWADNVYVGLDFSCPRVTDATTPMMTIFNMFDPISRMYSVLSRYSARSFNEVMETYNQPLTDTQRNIINEQKVILLGLGMTDAMIDQVIEAARCSGRAIYTVLTEYRR